MSSNLADRAIGAAFGFAVLAMIAADAFGQAAQLPAGTVPALAAFAKAMAQPALFLIAGCLAAAGGPVAGCPRGRAVPLLLAAYGLVALGRFGVALLGDGIDPAAALGVLADPSGQTALVPGLALMLWAAPVLRRLPGALLLAGGLAASLAAHRAGLGVVSATGGGFVFFVAGLRGRPLVEAFATTAARESGVLAGAVALMAIGFAAASSGVAGAPVLAELLGLCGSAAAVTLATRSAGSGLDAAVAWLGRQWPLLVLGLGVPLGVAGHMPPAAALVLVPLLGFALLADPEARAAVAGKLAQRRRARLRQPVPL